MKTCSICGSNKDESEFYLSKGRLTSACKLCTNSEAKKRRDRDPEKARAQDRARWPRKLAAQRNRRKDPEVRARDIEKHRAYRNRPGAREEENRRDRQVRADRRRKIQLLKMDRPCYDCGGVFDPEVMEWDHLPGTIKSFDLCRAPVHSLNDVVDEIAKCQLVCANCHRIRTIARRKGVV